MSDQRASAWDLWKTLPRVLPYVRPYRKLGALSAVLTILNAVTALARPWPLALMLDTVSGKRQSPFGIKDPYTLLSLAALGGLLLTLAIHAMNVGQSYVDSKLEQNMIFDLRSDLLQHCQRLSLTFHNQRRTGELMSRINNEASMLGSIVMGLPPLVESLLTLVGMAVIAFLIDWQIALVSLSAIPLVYFALGMYGKRVVPRLQDAQKLEWDSISIVHEAMSMMRVIVSYGRERHEHARFRTQGRKAVDARVQVTVRQTAFTLGVQTATAVGTALVFFFGFRAVFKGDLTYGGLVVLLSYIASIYAPLESISSTIGSLTEQLVGLRAAFALLDIEPEVTEDRHPVELARARGEVVFDDVSFAYHGRGAVLEHVSFVVLPGQRIAVVGPTGAGKTTLISLLIRFYDPGSGAVRIDGVDLRRLSLDSLHEQLAVVLQEPLLFSGTIAENIRYGRFSATADEVVEAAVAANAHEFVSRLPLGYETEIGEKGAQLSGGERQRICVARAFVRDAPILILDEPTSSIDSKTEQVILEALDRLMAGRTSFMIAHRLSTVRDADLIVVLDRGRVVQLGRHHELVAVDGLYRQLHDAQSRPAQPRLALVPEGQT